MAQPSLLWYLAQAYNFVLNKAVGVIAYLRHKRHFYGNEAHIYINISGDFRALIQGVFFNWDPPKSSKCQIT